MAPQLVKFHYSAKLELLLCGFIGTKVRFPVVWALFWRAKPRTHVSESQVFLDVLRLPASAKTTDYRKNRETSLGLCLALAVCRTETCRLLKRCGSAFTPSCCCFGRQPATPDVGSLGFFFCEVRLCWNGLWVGHAVGGLNWWTSAWAVVVLD